MSPPAILIRPYRATFSRRENGLRALEIVPSDSSRLGALRRYLRGEPLFLGERGWGEGDLRPSSGPYRAIFSQREKGL